MAQKIVYGPGRGEKLATHIFHKTDFSIYKVGKGSCIWIYGEHTGPTT